MAFCQTPVPKSSDLEEGTGWERLRLCPTCSFSFCGFCRRTWYGCNFFSRSFPYCSFFRHGAHTLCPIAYTEKLVLEYLALPGGSSKRVLIERRFGEANILKLVAMYKEEQANKQWFLSRTKACPGCNVKVEKSLGCNHVSLRLKWWFVHYIKEQDYR
jgi:E3 ubiquitin-protein ligase RNF14